MGKKGGRRRRSSEQLAERDQIGVASRGKCSTRFDFEGGVPVPAGSRSVFRPKCVGLGALQPNQLTMDKETKNHRLAWAGAYLEMLECIAENLE